MVLQWLDHQLVTLVRREGVWVLDSAGLRYLDAFSGGPGTRAAAQATLEVLEVDPLCQRAVRVGAYLHYRLTEIVAENPLLGEVRGAGLRQTVEVIADRHARTPDASVARRIASEMARRAVLVRSAGPRPELIRIRPPLSFTLENVDLLVNVLQEALRTVAPQ
jgi:4-aminobutyrate aminotransferase-like enzyme